MKNSRMKKFTLNKETLRNLQDSELVQAVGGYGIEGINAGNGGIAKTIGCIVTYNNTCSCPPDGGFGGAAVGINAIDGGQAGATRRGIHWLGP